MKILLPENTTHTIILQPRFEPVGLLDMFFDNTLATITEEQLQDDNDNVFIDKFGNVITVIRALNTYTYNSGVLSLTFNLDVLESDRYLLKVVNNDKVIFRGSLFCTSQEPQNYKLTNGKFEYV